MEVSSERKKRLVGRKKLRARIRYHLDNECWGFRQAAGTREEDFMSSNKYPSFGGCGGAQLQLTRTTRKYVLAWGHVGCLAIYEIPKNLTRYCQKRFDLC